MFKSLLYFLFGVLVAFLFLWKQPEPIRKTIIEDSSTNIYITEDRQVLLIDIRTHDTLVLTDTLAFNLFYLYGDKFFY